MKLISRVTQATTSAAPLDPLTGEAAPQSMRHYYRDLKLQLIANITDYRAGILSQLMAVLPVDDVFAPYFKPAEPARALRRAA